MVVIGGKSLEARAVIFQDVLALAALPVIGGVAYRIPPLTMEAWEERTILFDEKTGRVWPNAESSERGKYTKEYVLRQSWKSFVDDKFDLENVIQKEAEFSCAIAVMDKIGGWEEETWVGSRFPASMWMYTKAVICNGQQATCRITGSSNSDPLWKP